MKYLGSNNIQHDQFLGFTLFADLASLVPLIIRILVVGF